MSSIEIEIKDVNGSRITEQGPSPGRCSRQENTAHHHAEHWSSLVILSLVREESRLAKRIMSLWSVIY